MFISREKIERLSKWAHHAADTWQAEYILAAVSFTESSFFLIPPDVLLIPMVLAQKHKWFRFFVTTTLASVAGGLFGYLIGAVLFDSVGMFIVEKLHLAEGFDAVKMLFEQYDVWAMFISAFTPIPYKVFTIAGGVFGMNLICFVGASLAGRGLRFIIEAALMRFLGEQMAHLVLKYIKWFSLALVLAIIIAILVLR